MKVTHDEQAWVLDGLRIILRRMEFHAQDTLAVGCDPREIKRAGDKLRQCRKLIDSFENLAFDPEA